MASGAFVAADADATTKGVLKLTQDLGGTAALPLVVQASTSFKLSGVISPTQISANTDDYNPTGLATASVLRLSTDASRNLTGLQGGAAGRLIVIENVGSFPFPAPPSFGGCGVRRAAVLPATRMCGPLFAIVTRILCG